MSYGPTMHRLVPSEPEEHHETFKVFPPVPPPKLYDAPSLGKVKGYLVNEEEVDQLRITAIRRCSAILTDLAKLQKEPATLADLLQGPDAVRKLLVSRVEFNGAEEVERAMDRLELILGADAQVHDPRPEYGGHISLQDAREQVDALTAAMAPYRKMREQMK